MTVASLGSLFCVHDQEPTPVEYWIVSWLPYNCQPNHSQNPVKELLNMYALPKSNDTYKAKITQSRLFFYLLGSLDLIRKDMANFNWFLKTTKKSMAWVGGVHAFSEQNHFHLMAWKIWKRYKHKSSNPKWKHEKHTSTYPQFSNGKYGKGTSTNPQSLWRGCCEGRLTTLTE